MQLTVDSCNVAIILMSLVTLVFGILTGHYYYQKESTIMFYPLLIGFVCIFVDFYFINKRADLITGKTTDCPLN